MKKNILSRLNDLTNISRRASFSDMEQQIKKYKYGSDAFMQILESRYSCHAFTNHPVSEAKLDMILDAGRMAPSASNNQPTRIWPSCAPCTLATTLRWCSSSAAATRRPGYARATG